MSVWGLSCGSSIIRKHCTDQLLIDRVITRLPEHWRLGMKLKSNKPETLRLAPHQLVLYYGKLLLKFCSGSSSIFFQIKTGASRCSPQPAMGREIPTENAGGGEVAGSCNFRAQTTSQRFEPTTSTACGYPGNWLPSLTNKQALRPTRHRKDEHNFGSGERSTSDSLHLSLETDLVSFMDHNSTSRESLN